MSDLLSHEEIAAGLKKLNGWSLAGNTITKTCDYPEFPDAVRAINAIADVAESAGHHPNLHLHDYNKLTITIYTHSKGGITQNDLDLAGSIDAISDDGK